MKADLALGEFTCPITFEPVRPPRPVVKEEEGVTYVVQGDYEIAFYTVLRFADASALPVRARLFGEDSRLNLPGPLLRHPNLSNSDR